MWNVIAAITVTAALVSPGLGLTQRAFAAESTSAAGDVVFYRVPLMKGFRSGAGWHRGADVDRLSEQEAGVISNRLLRRAATKAPTVQDKRKVVEPALTEAIRRQLVSACASAQQCRDALLAAARPHLDPSELTALGEAIARGFTPVGGEQ